MLFNILALVATAAVAYVLAIQGTYRAVQALVAAVLAAVIAFGLFGPVTGWISSSADPASVWYYAADAFCLWLLFCAALLVLRTAAERMLPVQSDFPVVPDRIGGAVAGAAAGFVVVGVCSVVVQMLPTSPDFLGYEAFRYEKSRDPAQCDRVQVGNRLWLNWDRATLAAVGYLSSKPLGDDSSCVFRRYGDVYPPAENRTEGYAATLDAEDFLYYHWYRRWLAIRWRTGLSMGPVPESLRGETEGKGLVLESGRGCVMYDIDMRASRVERAAAIPDFPAEHASSGEDFLLITLRFSALNKYPRVIDSSQFYLADSMGGRVGRAPLVYGPARIAASRTQPGQKEGQVISSSFGTRTAPRNLRFSESLGTGHYLADGMTFEFADSRGREMRVFIFAVPKTLAVEQVRLMIDPNLPAGISIPSATPEPPKTAAPAQTPPATKPPPRTADPTASRNARLLLQDASRKFTEGQVNLARQLLGQVDRDALTTVEKESYDALSVRIRETPARQADEPDRPGPAGPTEPLFAVEAVEWAPGPLESHGLKVVPGKDHVLLVLTIRLTEAGAAMPKEELQKLGVADASKQYSRQYDTKLAAFGDFQVRLKGAAAVPCWCLPLAPTDKGPVMTFRRPTGEPDWLLPLGPLRVVASVPRGSVPEALIWGGQMEAPVPAPK